MQTKATTCATPCPWRDAAEQGVDLLAFAESCLGPFAEYNRYPVAQEMARAARTYGAAVAYSTSLGGRTPSSGSATCGGPLRSSSSRRRTRPSLDTSIGAVRTSTATHRSTGSVGSRPVREVLPELFDWWEAGEVVGVATVIATFRSAPRPPGASMLVGPGGTAVGSVSGGCVEGAVYELAQSVAVSGDPVLERYGVSDDDAFAVGLTCGGLLDVYVEKISKETFPDFGDVAGDVQSGRPVAVATIVEHPDPVRTGSRVIIRPGTDVGFAGVRPRRRGSPRRRRRTSSIRAQRHPHLRTSRRETW